MVRRKASWFVALFVFVLMGLAVAPVRAVEPSSIVDVTVEYASVRVGESHGVLSARVVDANSQPIQYRSVLFSIGLDWVSKASGSFPDGQAQFTGVSGADGTVTTPVLTGNTAAGTFKVFVYAWPATGAEINLTNEPADPVVVAPDTGADQIIAAGNPLFPFVGTVRDVYGNAVGNTPVTLTISGGTFDTGLTSSTQASDAYGKVRSPQPISGATPGTYSATAAIEPSTAAAGSWSFTVLPESYADWQNGWPACGVTRSTYCVEEVRVGGGPVAPDTWRVRAWMAGSTTVQWFVEEFNAGTWGAPTDRSTRVAFVLNTGAVEPDLTRLNADEVAIVAGGDTNSGHTLRVEATPVMLHWLAGAAGSACFGGAWCGGSTTAADLHMIQNGGHTQGIAPWGTFAHEVWGGTWTATDAQFTTAFPWFDKDYSTDPPTVRFTAKLGNPALQSEGGAPVLGRYSAFMPKTVLTQLGTTAAAAAAEGLTVERLDGTVATIVPGAISATPDEGVYLRVTDVHFSMPELRVSKARSTTLIARHAPDPPTYVEVTPVIDGGIVSFAPPAFDGGASILGYNLTCTTATSTHSYTTASAGSIEVRDLGSEATCTLAAVNSEGSGSPHTLTVAADPSAPVMRPGQPEDVSIVAARKIVVARWEAPAATGGAPITRYDVVARPAAGGDPVASVSTKQRNARLRLPTGSYVLEISAVNSAGSSWPATAMVTVP